MLFTNFDFQDYLEIIQHSDFQDENKTIRNNIFTIVYSGKRRPPIPVQRRPVGFVVF
jgi:hypothetical protein